MLASAAVFITVYALSGAMPVGNVWAKRLRRVAGMDQPAGAEASPAPEFGSLAHKLALVGIRVAPGRELAAYRMILAAGALTGVAVAVAAGLPPLPALGSGAVGAFLAKTFLDSRLSALRKRVERELPVALHRIAALMALSASTTELMRVAASGLLLADTNSPLGRELSDAAQRVASEGPAAWEGLMARARVISPSLELLYYELRRFAEMGGAHFGEALRAAAASQAKLLDARERARGKGDAAISSLRIIALVMVGLLTFLVVDPVYRPVVASLPGQILVAGAFVAMAFGYWFVSKMVEDVL
ncbi:MAG: type II secretion system F family protein [Anaerolineae bacterium]